jgi:hypothetical protein
LLGLVGLFPRTRIGGIAVKETKISVPELAMVAGTRAALGAGLGLLLADRLSDDQRRAVGWTLVLIGALSSIPLALEVFGGDRLSSGTAPLRPMTDGQWSEANERQWSAFTRT